MILYSIYTIFIMDFIETESEEVQNLQLNTIKSECRPFIVWIKIEHEIFAHWTTNELCRPICFICDIDHH